VHDWNGDGVLSGDEVRWGARRSTRAVGEDVDFNPASTATWTTDAFREIDRNGDNRITPGEWYYSPEYFRRADRNRDNVLSMTEFSGDPDTTTTWDDDRDDLFADLDANGNGRIDRYEWHGTREAFEWMDRNNDNILSRAEVVGDSSNQFNAFTSIDANGNGTLSFNEWRWSRASFDRYDRNGDGIVNRQEFNASGGAPAPLAR
jgi:Ca2+-binding EF-hand superfamily protein